MQKASISIICLVFLMGCAMNEKKKIEQATLDAVDNIQLKIAEKDLSNGLKIIAIENRKLPLFSFYTFVKAGGRHELGGFTGGSHYLEHMMFKGSKKYGPGEFEKAIEGNGGSNNAYTNADMIVYYESLPIDAFEKIVDVEADRMFNLRMLPESFEKERSVIFEERKYRYENSPRGQLLLKTLTEAYKGTPYETPVIGYVKDLKSVTIDQMQKYYETFYDPANMIVVVSGDFSASDAIDAIAEKFEDVKSKGDFKKVKAKIDRPENYQFRKDWGETYSIKGATPLPMFMLAFQSDEIGGKDSFVMDVLASAIGGGESSYLNQNYVKTKRPMVSNIYSFNYNMQQSGLLMIGGQLLKGMSPKKFELRIRKDLNNICSKALSAREVQKVKNQVLVDYFSQFESNSGLAHLVGKRQVYYKDPHFYKKEISKYLSVELDQVKDLCERRIQNAKPIFVSVWSQHK